MRCCVIVFVVWALALTVGGCGEDDTTTAEPRTTPSAATTSEPPESTDRTTSSVATSTTASSTAPSSTTASPVVGPDYIVAGADGVFRVVNGEAILVMNRSDVSWAADDGMGGVIYHAQPGFIDHVPLGATTPVRIATDATPNYVTRIDGKPTLEISQIQQDECENTDSQHAALVDLTTGRHRLYAPCIPLQSWGVLPQSIGGDLSVAIDGGGWPDEEPVSARLAFRGSELPDSITALTGWDEAALRVLAELELDLPANPWSQPCHWCTLDARLSSDGTSLASVEFVPSPTDLGASDWAEFDALDLSEQWRRWEELRRTADIRLRVVDLDTGDTRYSALWPGPGSLLDYDGRYLVYRFEGPGHHSQFPLNTHLIDATSGEEIPINWGTPDPGQQGSITLALPG